MLHRARGRFDALNRQIDRIDARLSETYKTNAICRLFATIPGVGPIAATAFAASIPDPSDFRSGCEFAAWLGLKPLRQNEMAQVQSRRDGKAAELRIEKARRVFSAPERVLLIGPRPMDAIIAGSHVRAVYT